MNEKYSEKYKCKDWYKDLDNIKTENLYMEKGIIKELKYKWHTEKNTWKVNNNVLISVIHKAFYKYISKR